jgi:hypothetical protein
MTSSDVLFWTWVLGLTVFTVLSNAYFWAKTNEKPAAGEKGSVGAVGPTGFAGATGAVGPAGIQGPQGMVGPRGNIGATGATGVGVVGPGKAHISAYYTSGTQSFVSSSFTTIAFTAANTSSGITLASNTFTVTTAGLYKVEATLTLLNSNSTPGLAHNGRMKFKILLDTDGSTTNEVHYAANERMVDYVYVGAHVVTLQFFATMVADGTIQLQGYNYSVDFPSDYDAVFLTQVNAQILQIT